MERIDEMIERYFEATLSEEEETALKAFLASPEGQAPEYDEVRAVMGFFAAGRVVRQAHQPGKRAHQPSSRSLSLSKGSKGWWFDRLTNRPWMKVAAIAASLTIIITLGVSLYNKENICVSFVDGKKVTDKEVVMNDVDNILADLLSDRTGMEEQLNEFFGQ